MDLDEKSFAHKAVLAEISRAKDAGVSAGEYLKQAQATGDFRRIRIGQIFQEYQRRMFAAGAMERYEELFTSRRMIDKVIKVYENKN